MNLSSFCRELPAPIYREPGWDLTFYLPLHILEGLKNVFFCYEKHWVSTPCYCTFSNKGVKTQVYQLIRTTSQDFAFWEHLTGGCSHSSYWLEQLGLTRHDKRNLGNLRTGAEKFLLNWQILRYASNATSELIRFVAMVFSNLRTLVLFQNG